MQKEEITRYFENICHEHQLRITHQRLAIYLELAGDTSHPTADDIFQRIRTQYPHISFDTVNRTLLSFAAAGIVKIAESGRPKRYDPDLSHHHHFKCLECNCIIDFNNSNVDNIELPPEITSNHKVYSQRIVVHGTCQNCLNSTYSEN